MTKNAERRRTLDWFQRVVPEAAPASGLRDRAEVPIVSDVPDVAAIPKPTSSPRLIKTRAELANEPLEPRDAFILTLLDGSDVITIIDSSGMPAEEVVAILSRLSRLGIVSLH